jgi:hypothetical protein
MKYFVQVCKNNKIDNIQYEAENKTAVRLFLEMQGYKIISIKFDYNYIWNSVKPFLLFYFFASLLCGIIGSIGKHRLIAGCAENTVFIFIYAGGSLSFALLSAWVGFKINKSLNSKWIGVVIGILCLLCGLFLLIVLLHNIPGVNSRFQEYIK